MTTQSTHWNVRLTGELPPGAVLDPAKFNQVLTDLGQLDGGASATTGELVNPLEFYFGIKSPDREEAKRQAELQAESIFSKAGTTITLLCCREAFTDAELDGMLADDLSQ